MKLYNTRTKNIEAFTPLKDNTVRMYTCGPTVYDHAHIGNLSSFIFADTLRRTLIANGYSVRHVMNSTDVDDKTIRRSQTDYPDEEPVLALQKLTRNYERLFFDDMTSIGNDIEALDFLRATESLDDMRGLITKLHNQGLAYIADDGVYFDIAAYKKTRTYGQLSHITTSSTSSARIKNDEYDKESAHDFALWKLQKPGEPAWEFELDGHNLLGRPGWHIECSAMSVSRLRQPFDIHTGGIDLTFPHHENEIAQSTAGDQPELYANFFCHNEHLLVDGKKMSKSLGNFYTLVDIVEKGYEPLAFRLLTLQGHYRNQVNFTWESLMAAQNRLHNLRKLAELRWQTIEQHDTNADETQRAQIDITAALEQDLDTPQALRLLSEYEAKVQHVSASLLPAFTKLLMYIDDVLGLRLLAKTPDISAAQKEIIDQREKARVIKDFATSDKLRDTLEKQGIEVLDTAHGPIWHRLYHQ